MSDALVGALPESPPVTSIERILQGWGNESWIAETALGRLVVKVGLPEADVTKWRAAATGLALARSADLPVPDLLAFVDAADEVDGRILRVFSYIPGSIARVDAPESFFRELGAEVRRLHSIPQPQFTSRVGGDGFDRWSDFLDHRWDAVLGRVAQAEIDPTLVARVKTLASSLAADVDEVATPKLCHRDLYLDNVLVDENGSLVALLDFDMVEVWDPTVEFFKLEWFVFDPRPAARAAFMEAYLAGGSLPPMFEQRVRLASIVELMNHAASWRLSGKPEIADEALDRLARLVNEGR